MNDAASGAEVRAGAARALDRIVRGRSLRSEFASAAAHVADPRDRALLSALLHAGARWWLRYVAALPRLLERPLPARESTLQALLVLGLVQLEVLQLPAYAVLDATVEAARLLGRPRFAALVNALLRRWQRERAAHGAALDADPVTRTAHPAWLLDAFAADWPQAAATIAAAGNAEPPLWLRANRRRATREQLALRLAADGFEALLPERPVSALQLARSVDVTSLSGFAEGLFSVQDAAAQFAAELLDLHDGQRVLDACAAPGGKSAHILECADVRLLALDHDARRLPRIDENLRRLGLQAEVRAGDATRPADWADGRRFERILIDAPCSATGIIRRQPDVRLHRRRDDIGPLAATQRRMLDALWPLLAPGGRLVYATCSLLDAENAAQIVGFAARTHDARVLPVAPPGWHRCAAGAQNLPGESGMDGFYYAVVEKAR